MRVAICGGRDYAPTERERAIVLMLLWQLLADDVITGGATGVDTWAAELARDNGYLVECVPEQWETYGKPAGPLRNRLMASMAHVVIALPGGRGTADMVEAAREAGCVLIDLRSMREETVNTLRNWAGAF